MPYKTTFNSSACGAATGHPSSGSGAWWAAACCAGWMPPASGAPYLANTILWDNNNQDCFYSHDLAGYTGCPNGSLPNLTNLLTASDYYAPLTLYGPTQPIRCNNAFLRPGYFLPGNVNAYYNCNTSGLAYGSYGNSTYFFQPGLNGLDDNIGGAHCANSLDASCKNLYGAAAVCFDVHGTVVTCSTFNPGVDNYYWRVNAPAWDNSLGACVSSVDVLGSGHTPVAGKNRSPFYQGCPVGTAATALTPQDFGLLTNAGGQNPTWAFGPSDLGTSGISSVTPPRGRLGGPGDTYYFFSSYAINVINGDPTGLSTTTGNAPCYSSFSGQSCPANSVDNGLSPKGCSGVTLAPACLSPATYQTSKAGAPGTGPWCITELQTFLTNLQLDLARNAYGQLFVMSGGQVSAKADGLTELSQLTANMGASGFASIHCRGDGTLDIFYVDNPTISSVFHERLSYLYSDESGRIWKPTPVGFNEWDQTVDPGGDRVSISYTPAQTGRSPQGAFQWARPTRIYDKTAADAKQNYGCHVLMEKEKQDLAVVLLNRDGAWYCYRMKQDPPPAWTWQISDPVFIANGEKQSGWFQRLPSGEFEFIFYDTSGHLRWGRCEEIAFDSVASWNWYAEGALHDEWDGQTLERFSAISYHDTRDGLLVEVCWVPDQLGDVPSGSYTAQGHYYILAHTWNPTTKVFDAAPGLVDTGIHKLFGGGKIIREKTGQWVLRLLAGGVYRCDNLDSLGNGTWTLDV